MIISFRDPATEDIYNNENTKAARKACPQEIWGVARRKLDQLNRAAVLQDLAAPPNNRLKPLKGDREGQHSIRINDQYRICFVWTEQGPENAEITDYH
jgi:proteic killer suppression protein